MTATGAATGVVKGSVVAGFLDDGANWSPSFGVSWTRLLLDDLHGNQRLFKGGSYLREVCSTGGIPDGRNQVAATFLDKTRGEWLWFIDTDMGFPPNAVDRLVASADKYKRPIMGGLCFALRRVETDPDTMAQRFGIIPTLYNWREYEGEFGFEPSKNYPLDKTVEVGGTGMACVLIHRRALEKIREHDGDQWFTLITHPTGLHGKPRTFGEDLSFCVRAAACDLPIWVDTSVKTSHDKGGLHLEEPLFLAQQKSAEASPESTSAA